MTRFGWLVTERMRAVEHRDRARLLAKKLGMSLKTVLQWRRCGLLSDKEIKRIVKG